MIDMVAHRSNRLAAALTLAREFKPWKVYSISDDDGRAVYIGASTRLHKRYRNHLTTAQNERLRSWLALNAHVLEVLDEYATKRAMLDAEREYIELLRPQFNTVYLT